MKNTCDFHPTKTAHFYCEDCDLCYCPSCVIKRDLDQYGKKRPFYYCPKCEGMLDRVATSDVITPFWNRLHKFFVYPFSLYPLILMVALSLATLLYAIPFFGFMVKIIASIMLVKYSFEALIKTAEGSFTPPELSSRTLSEDVGIVFKQIGLYIILGAVFFLILYKVGIIAAILFFCFALLSFPSMLIVLVTTNSLLNALNPILFVGMAWRIGWGYLLMYLFIILLWGAPAFIGKYVIAYIPTQLHLIIITMAESYYTIISYHLMGYVLLQYHDRIGYEVELDEKELVSDGLSSAEDEVSDLLNRLDILIKEGNTDDAIYLIKNQAGENLSNPELSERYYNLLKIKGRIPEMLEHAKAYLEVLSKINKKEKLCEVYLECTLKSNQFKPSNSSIFKIASALNETARHKEAVSAYNRFVKSDPQNQMVPKAYFLGAKIINDKLRNPKKALRILQGIIKKYPNHEIIPYVKRTLKEMRAS
ncbi:tetratricopeptide repeat protein [Thermodesulfobacteriota bacterium]